MGTEIDAVTKTSSAHPVQALAGVFFAAATGELLAIVGAPRTSKSTLVSAQNAKICSASTLIGVKRGAAQIGGSARRPDVQGQSRSVNGSGPGVRSERRFRAALRCRASGRVRA
jgi:ABC-type phosphate/phosphonate transport system ATPase subunit